MTDYTKQIDWAARGTSKADVLAVDHDTELDAIATAIATKTEVAAAPTAGNLANVTSGGKLEDTGIAGSKFDNVDGVIQTQIDAAISTPAAPTNHIRAGNVYLNNGEYGQTAFDVGANVTEAAWETIGPTGSGADNIWSALDNVDSRATILILTIYVDGTWGGGQNDKGGIIAYGTIGDNTNPSPSWTNEIMRSEKEYEDASEDWVFSHKILLACDSDQKFYILWAKDADFSLTDFDLHYNGFMID